MNKIKRRDVLKGGGAMLVGSLLQNKGEGQTPNLATAQANKPKTANPGAGNYTTLECKWITKTFEPNDPAHKVQARLRSFNGQVPGPMLKTRPGDTVKIRIKNSLGHYDSTGWNGDHNVPHMLNTTNLHLHGLDIMPHLFEPLGTSNPLSRMIAIEPGATYDYSFKIPDNHPPGMYWYHPHHHGSTAVQALSGMAGGVIIYGDIDKVPEIAKARDIPLVIQDLALFPSDTVPNVWDYNPKQNAIWQTFGGNVTIYDPATGVNVPQPQLKGGFSTGDYTLHYYLINGEPFFRETHNSKSPQAPTVQQLGVPRFTVAPGEVVRFRMLNATADNMMPIAVEGHTMYLLALDGVNFPAVQAIPPQPINGTTPQVLLASANRAEFLIQASATPKVYQIVQQAQNQQFIQSAQKTIAEIEVKGPAKNMALPDVLPFQKRYYPFIEPSEIQRVRTIEFSGAFPAVMNPYVGGDFSINNALYQETAVPNVVNLTGVEEWHIIVGDGHHGGTEGHPFHIHVNHFEVISITTTDASGKTTTVTPNTIQDTIWVPVNSTAVIRTKFKQWTGKAVYHCHILPHEDTGMMGNFLITSPGTAAPHHTAGPRKAPPPPKK
ncbi:MAG TPA: multicopper oxidase domain-containing protein [Blastocatellia bacterium]|nr:multicopper oxidase domain-containing protein [Blastocatellia bacterium]